MYSLIANIVFCLNQIITLLEIKTKSGLWSYEKRESTLVVEVKAQLPSLSYVLQSLSTRRHNRAVALKVVHLLIRRVRNKRGKRMEGILGWGRTQ